MSSRWAFIFAGIIDVLFGIILVLYPSATVGFILVLFGIYAIVQGIALLIAGFTSSELETYRWWLIGGAAVSILAGILALFYPTAAITLLILFIAIRALVVGFSELLAAIRLRKVIANEWLLGFVGVLNILFGIYLLFYPLISASLLILILGWYSIIIGIVTIFRGLRLSAASA